MARSRSTYTASPSRYRSLTRSPTRRVPSEAESRYELDLDALGGPESTGLETTEMLENGKPKVNAIRSDEIDGPDDFTMNMEYWMRVPLPLREAQLRSKKEAEIRVDEVGEEVEDISREGQDTTGEGERQITMDDSYEKRERNEFESGSRTVRVNGTEDEKQHRRQTSESSMGNEEKVLSYLDALPDTDIGDAHTSTPLKLQKSTTLQVPTASAQKARSLRPTVEDYTDTPRKVTQETVIHNASKPAGAAMSKENADTIALLQSRLDEQEKASKARVSELEAITTFTRTELDLLRSENFRKTERISALEKENEEWARSQEATSSKADTRLKQQEEDLRTRMQEFGEELRLQNRARLQNQKAEFEEQLRTLETSRLAAERELVLKNQSYEQLQAEANARDQSVNKLQTELEQSRKTKDQALEDLSKGKEERERDWIKERAQTNEKMASLQSKAEELQRNLEKATAEAKTAREEAQNHAALQSSATSPTTRSVALESRVQSLQNQLDSSRSDVAAKDQDILRSIEEQERLEKRFTTSQSHISTLDATITALRQQILSLQSETSAARTETKRCEEELRSMTERQRNASTDNDLRVSESQKELERIRVLKTEAEGKVEELQTDCANLKDQHVIEMEKMRSKAEDAVRKAGVLLEEERTEKKKITKRLKTTKAKLERLQAEAMYKVAAQESSSDEEDDANDRRDVEIENLRNLLRKQVAVTKSAKADASSLRIEVASLTSDIQTLRQESENQRDTFQAVNRALDERLATLLSTVLKTRTKGMLDQRDQQWVANVEHIKEERDFMGRVLLREWGRQECGVAKEKEKQLYQYQYVKQ